MLNKLIVYAERKYLTVNTQKSEVMWTLTLKTCPLCTLTVYCSPTQTQFKYLGMVCDKQINLNTAADAALRPFTAGTFEVKEFVQKHNVANRLHAYIWLLNTYAIPAGLYASQFWATTPYLQQGKEVGSPLQKWLLAV